MSLDISLHLPVRRPHCNEVIDEEEVFTTNITHNLAGMAEEAGIYWAIWHGGKSQDGELRSSEDLIPVIEKGLEDMKQNPDKYKPFSATNGWGTYDQFVPWVEELLQAMRDYPGAKVYCSR